MKSQSTETLALSLAGQNLILDPSGAIFWEKERALIVADLHLGRETVLQKAGMSFPGGASQQTLKILAATIARYEPKTLVILGDMVHARSGMSLDLNHLLQHTRRASLKVNWVLVEGNHDRGSRQAIQRLAIDVFEPPIFMHPFVLTHETTEPNSLVEVDGMASCQTEGASNAGNPSPNLPRSMDANCPASIKLCGHVHPGFRIPMTRDVVRCFHWNGLELTLPAFGDISGSKRLHPRIGETLYLLTGQSVVPWRRQLR